MELLLQDESFPKAPVSEFDDDGPVRVRKSISVSSGEDAPRQFDLCTATDAPRGPNDTISASQRSALCGFACGRPSPRRGFVCLTDAGVADAAGAGALSRRRSTSSAFFPPTFRPCARSLSFSTGTVSCSKSLREAASVRNRCEYLQRRAASANTRLRVGAISPRADACLLYTSPSPRD